MVSGMLGALALLVALVAIVLLGALAERADVGVGSSRNKAWRDLQRKCLTNTEISSLPYKTPWKNYREGMILPVTSSTPYHLRGPTRAETEVTNGLLYP